jgi:hypothetical protein
MQRMLAEEVPLDKPVWGVHNDASRGLEAGARFGVLFDCLLRFGLVIRYAP